MQRCGTRWPCHRSRSRRRWSASRRIRIGDGAALRIRASALLLRDLVQLGWEHRCDGHWIQVRPADADLGPSKEAIRRQLEFGRGPVAREPPPSASSSAWSAPPDRRVACPLLTSSPTAETSPRNSSQSQDYKSRARLSTCAGLSALPPTCGPRRPRCPHRVAADGCVAVLPTHLAHALPKRAGPQPLLSRPRRRTAEPPGCGDLRSRQLGNATHLARQRPRLDPKGAGQPYPRGRRD